MIAKHFQRSHQLGPAVGVQPSGSQIRPVLWPVKMRLLQECDFGPQIGNAIDTVQGALPGYAYAFVPFEYPLILAAM